MKPAIFIDGFAGGGGASTGIAQALGCDVDIALNHSPEAIAIHKANHPTTEHHCQDIRAAWPRITTRGRPVAGMWMSPDCKEFSKAKGGPVKDRSIRTLADEIPYWIEETEPEVVYVENVEEFEDWGPLEQGEDGKWRVILDRKGEDFKKWVRKCRRLGYLVEWRQLRACNYGAPTSRKRLYIVMKRKRPGARIVWPKPTHGAPNSPGVLAGKLLPYRTAAECIDWSIPVPSIFGRQRELAEATKRRIAHGVMRYVVKAARPYIVEGDRAPHITKFYTGSVGSPIDKEMPTVTANGQPARPAGANPLGMVDATVVPFVSYGQQGGLNRPLDAPFHTATASRKDTNGIVAATMVQTGWGEREGQAPRALDVEKPLGTIMSDGNKHAAVEAELVQAPHIMTNRNAAKPFTAANEPTHTITAGGAHQNAVTAFLTRFYGSDRTGAGGNPEQPLATARAGGTHHAVVAAHIEQANTGMVGHAPEKPLSTIVGKGCTQRIVETTLIEEGALPPELMDKAVRTAAFLVKYYATDGDNEVAQSQAIDRSIDTITTKARFAVVTVTIDAVTYVIVDIGLRMLTPRELANAQGFPRDYILNPIVRKFLRGKWVERPLTIAEQISAIGNSVCPPVARALVAANSVEAVPERLAA